MQLLQSLSSTEILKINKTWIDISKVKIENIDKREKKDEEEKIDKNKEIIEIVKYISDDMVTVQIPEDEVVAYIN